MIFHDSYALFELIAANPAYVPYKKDVLVTSALNIGELYYGLLKVGGKALADHHLTNTHFEVLEIDTQTVIEAMIFRLKHIKRKFSTVDCISYTLAQRHGMTFLTGDRQFEGMDGVEFVK